MKSLAFNLIIHSDCKTHKRIAICGGVTRKERLISLMFKRCFESLGKALSLAVTVMFVGGPMEAQEVPLSSPDYRICYNKMMSPPLSLYSELITTAETQENIRRSLLEQELTGVRCSDHRIFRKSRDAPRTYQGSRGIATNIPRSL